MNESILNTIKKLIGIDRTDDSFDLDMVKNINSTFNILRQMGFRDVNFRITGPEEIWSDYFVEEDSAINDCVISYIHHKVAVMFDPPSGAAKDASDALIAEYEWRINNEVDYRS